MRTIRALLLAATLSTFAASCISLGASDPGEQDVQPVQTVTLVVQNDNFADVDVYLLRSGMATRIGRVSSGATRRFTLTPAQLGPGDIRFVAAPSVGNGAANSGSLVVLGGQTVEFRVAPVFAQSVATVY